MSRVNVIISSTCYLVLYCGLDGHIKHSFTLSVFRHIGDGSSVAQTIFTAEVVFCCSSESKSRIEIQAPHRSSGSQSNSSWKVGAGFFDSCSETHSYWLGEVVNHTGLCSDLVSVQAFRIKCENLLQPLVSGLPASDVQMVGRSCENTLSCDHSEVT